MLRVVCFTLLGAAAGVSTVWLLFDLMAPEIQLRPPVSRWVVSVILGCLPGAVLGAVFGAASAVLAAVGALRRELTACRQPTVAG